MSGSKLLEQAIVDAQALRDSAFKSAQAALVEKFAPQIKEAVEKLLEQGPEEDPAAMAGSPEDAMASDIPAGTDFGGAAPDASDKSFVAGKAKDIPLAATDGEKLCPCPDDDDEIELKIDLSKLSDELKIGKEDEEEPAMEPQATGMQNQPQAAGGTGLTESLELEEIELEEEQDFLQAQGDQMVEMDKNVDEEISEVSLDEILSESEEDDEDDSEETDEEDEEDETDEDDKGELDKEKSDLDHNGKLSRYEKARGKAIQTAIKDKKETNESTVKQLMSTSAQLLKEHQNTVKLVEKKDSQIQKLLEENKKFSSIIEEMSEAFKKLEEVNTLNATLFYSNQVLKSASLNERQKTNIVEAISKADSVSEAKAVYETLVNSVGGTAEKERSPKSLNEAINKRSSFRLPHKQVEQSSDPGKDRWLKLAGIK